MNKAKIRLVMLTVALLFHIPAVAQDDYLPIQIKDSIVTHEPDWQLQHDGYFPDSTDSLGAKFMFFRWVSGKLAIGAEIYIHDSMDSTEKKFKELGESNTTFRLERIQGKKIPNLGDDNYLLKVMDDSGGGYSIVFRKGKIVVQMWANSEALARKFATHIAAVLPAAA